MLLLVVAWFCANRPQGFVDAFVGWIQHGPRWHNQEALAAAVQGRILDLARTAATEESPALAATPAKTKAPARSAPSEPLFKRSDLYLSLSLLAPSGDGEMKHISGSTWALQVYRRDTPHPPPRTVV